MKKIHLIILLAGLLALSMIGLSACDDMTGVSDKSANQTITSQAVQGVVNNDAHSTSIVMTNPESGPINPCNTFTLKATTGKLANNVTDNWTWFNVDYNGERIIEKIDEEEYYINTEKFTVACDQNPGEYKVNYTIRMWNNPETQDETNNEYFDIVIGFDLNIEFPAAPAIAARILEANEVAPRYGSGRTGGNYIADVAHNMGTGTDFDGIPKELWVDDEKAMNQAYWDAVWDFLKVATDKDLDAKPEGYIW